MASEKFCENESAVTFCVTVILKRGSEEKTVARNFIRKFSTGDSWFDVFDITTDDMEDDVLPRSCFDNFEKQSTITVSSKPSSTLSISEQYSPNAYDKISVLTDFDKTLKYVTIEIRDTSSTETQEKG